MGNIISRVSYANSSSEEVFQSSESVINQDFVEIRLDLLVGEEHLFVVLRYEMAMEVSSMSYEAMEDSLKGVVSDRIMVFIMAGNQDDENVPLFLTLHEAVEVFRSFVEEVTDGLQAYYVEAMFVESNQVSKVW